MHDMSREMMERSFKDAAEIIINYNEDYAEETDLPPIEEGNVAKVAMLLYQSRLSKMDKDEMRSGNEMPETQSGPTFQ